MQTCLSLIPDDCERVFLAYSGGLDSSVLLHLLLAAEPRFQIIPWHVNHGLLDIAPQMEAFCTEQAGRYGLELRVDRLDLAGVDSNVEAEARERRYRLFEQATGARDCLLTAHHADDQAETFLLNALRGSGSAGLRGIAECRRFGQGWILRPLLAFSRAQLEDYAHRHELAWFNDPSNRDLRFDRNYLRHQVIPAIATRWPHFQTALESASRLQGETQRMLDDLAQIDLDALAREAAGGQPTLDLQGLLQLSPGRRKNLVRYWVASAGMIALPAARLRELMKQLDARPDALPEISMPGYSIRLYDQRLFLVGDGDHRDCHGVFEFGLQPLLNIDECDFRLQRKDLFARLQLDDRDQRVTLRFRGEGQLGADTHRLKRLFQKHRIPPWQRQSTAQVYLDDELAGLLT